jgi:hypothetical protein
MYVCTYIHFVLPQTSYIEIRITFIEFFSELYIILLDFVILSTPEFLSYNIENMLVKVSRPRLLQCLLQAYAADENYIIMPLKFQWDGTVGNIMSLY